jgi:hypothetical protein
MGRKGLIHRMRKRHEIWKRRQRKLRKEQNKNKEGTNHEQKQS